MSQPPVPPEPPRKRRRTRVVAAAAIGVPLVLSGCSHKQSILSTNSPPAHNITILWWWMLAAAVIVFAGAVGMLVAAWFRRGTPGLPLFGEREGIPESLVLLFGIAVPVVVLSVLFAVSNVYLVKQTSPPSPSSTAMSMNVIGHQFWWEVRYGGSAAVTANEIHIPTRTRVNVVTTTNDVIHSFWVPALNRKIDMIPGRSNRVLLYASSPGTYRGQCSQFCGPQHANMDMYVVAQPPAQFRTWLAQAAAPATPPVSPAAQFGARVFLSSQCASCHRIAGTLAQGFVGPDLTHLASRSTLAALTIPNTPAELAAWIRNPQGIKPGALMPALGLPENQISALVAYLEGLR